MIIHPSFFNPNAFLLKRFVDDPQFRHIILYGGSSSGKSYSIAQIILLQTLTEKTNAIVFRKVGASIKDTIYQDFKTAAVQLKIADCFTFRDGINLIKCNNGARIVFKGCDDSEKIKGLSSFKRVVLDEWNEFDEEDTKQIRKRLRGMEGQQIIYAFNPISEEHWIKRNVFDKEEWEEKQYDYLRVFGLNLKKEYCEVKSVRFNKPKPMLNPRTGQIDMHPTDTVVIQSTYLNNFWVVGSPDGTYGFYDEQCIADFERDRINDPNYYNIYALGEWGVLRTGSEFFGSFNRGVHCKKIDYDPELPIHISVDSNVLPYITITYWQVDTANGMEVKQIGETLAESPNNTVRKSAKLVADKLIEMGVYKVYLHGDASTKAANNIDDEKRSFLDLFIDTLQKDGIEVIDCVGNKNPSVSMSGEFINAIFDNIIPNIKIMIGENCRSSIDDYLSVQKDVNGAILKTKVKNKITKQTYEQHGHISDTFRYLCVDVLREQFLEFSKRRKRNLYAKDGFIKFFNPQIENKYEVKIMYVIPNLNGNIVYLIGCLCGQKWHITEAAIVKSLSTEWLKSLILARDADEIVIECQDSYFPFIRTLREELPTVKAMRLSGDIEKRIAATSDLVKEMLLFNPDNLDNDIDQGAFVANLLDFGQDKESIEAGAVVSGFIQFASKWMLNR